jgi:hypothetical protein
MRVGIVAVSISRKGARRALSHQRRHGGHSAGRVGTSAGKRLLVDAQFVGTATSALLLALAPASALAFATTSGDPTGLADDDAAAKEEAEKVRGCVC